MITKTSDIRELTLNELDTVSGGENVDVFKVGLWGYGFAVGVGDGFVCVTTITPDEDNVVCVGKGGAA
jgi:hypothetical protein